MKKTLPTLNFSLGFVIFSSLAAALQLIAALTLLEKNCNYFPSNSWLSSLAVLCAILGAVCGTVAAYRIERQRLAKHPFFASKIPSLFSAAGFLVLAVLFLSNTLMQGTPLTLLSTAFSLLAALYAVLSAFPSVAKKARDMLALLGFAAILAGLLANAYFYFDTTVEMNSPLKFHVQIGLLIASLYFTGEIRFHLKRPNPRFFLVLASWTVAIGALSAPAMPLAYLAGRIDRTDYAAGALATLLIAISAAMRIYVLTHPFRVVRDDDEEELSHADPFSQEESTGDDSL